MIQIRVLVKKLLCLDCQERHGTPDATFERGPGANIYDPKSLVCPRCGGVNTLPEVDVEIREGEAVEDNMMAVNLEIPSPKPINVR